MGWVLEMKLAQRVPAGVIVTGFGFASARAPSHKAAKREKKRTVRMLRIR